MIMTRPFDNADMPDMPAPIPSAEHETSGDAPERSEEDRGRGEGGASTAVKKGPSRPKADRLPPYKVLLHNDSVNEMLYVIESITTLTPHDRPSATKIMLEAHTSGVALVLTTHKERAELYQEQFRSKQLLVTLEPAE
jgi:ATP-dependent Clp protease adaptor protein ClpS